MSVDEGLDLRLKWLILAAIIGYLLYLLGPVLSPFMLAALFAYLLDPLTDRIEALRIGRWRVGRALATSLVSLVMVVIVVAVFVVLVPFVQRQIAHFLEQLPSWISWFQGTAAPWVAHHLGISADALDTRQLLGMLQAHWKEAGGAAATVVAKVSQSGMALVGWIMHIVIVPVAAFYLLRDWDVLVAHVHAMVPRGIEPTVARLAHESDSVLGAFLRGQLSVMVVLGIFYGAGLWLVGIDVGPLIGMIAGLISFVPYMGAITGVVIGVIAALVQYQDWAHVLLVLGVFAVGQLLEGYVLVPKLVGDKIGLHPVAVIFAILAGGELFGFLGILLALPVASVAVVLLRYAYQRYTNSELYQSEAETPHIVVPGGADDPAEPVLPATPVVSGEDAMIDARESR